MTDNAETTGDTHINGHMADQTGMMRQANVVTLIMYPVGSHRALRPRIFVDNKGALHIDLDGPGIGDGLLQAGGPGSHGIGIGMGVSGHGNS